jgi:hypothetical protein
LQSSRERRDGWLGLSRVTLAFTTPRRSPGALPVLIEALKDRDDRVRAAAALKKIDPEAAKKAGIK